MGALVYIIILVFNGRNWIDNCLNSVLKTEYTDYKVLIVDNFSQDGSVDYIKSNFPGTELIENQKNYGFAEGNNIGIRYALSQGAEYIILLNQDTKVDPFWVSELVKLAEQDDKIGILSPMQYDYEGLDLDSNFRIIIESGKQVTPDFIETDRVIGSAVLLKNKLCRTVGLFDSIFFIYHEESDLCRRYRYFGYKVGIATKSKICHWHSLIHYESISSENKKLFVRNELIYWLKDPNRILIVSFFRYFAWKLFISVKSLGFLKGLSGFFRLCIKQIPTLKYIPLIILRRRRERRLILKENVFF